MTRSPKANSILLAGAGAALALALVLIAVQGFYTRFHADDFCMAAAVNQHGFFGAQANWYLTWSGRYAYFLVTSLLAVIGPSLAPFVPLAVMLAWLGGLVLLFRRLPFPVVVRPVLFAVLVLFTVLSTLPNRFQSLYWQNGMVNYTLPLVLLTFAAAWVAAQARAELRPGALLLALNALVALALGGFSETALAVQITLLAIAFAATFMPGWRVPAALRPLLLAWLAGSLAALVIVFTAPGNAVRQADVGFAAPGLLRIVTFSLRNAAHIAGKFVLWHPVVAAASLLLPLALGWLHPSPLQTPASIRGAVRAPQVQRLVLLPLAGFALVAAACAPTVYAMNAYPDDRVIVVPQYLLVLTVVLWGLLAGRVMAALFAQRLPWLGPVLRAAALIAVLAAAVLSARDTLSTLPAELAYAAQWDARHAALQAQVSAGETYLTAGPLDSRYNLMELSESPDGWVNACMAGFYGVESISGR